jgi:hypothetical protein
MNLKPLRVAAAAALSCLAQAAHAQGVATDTQLLERVIVAGQRSASLTAAAGGAKYSVSAQQLAVEKNLFNPEDALESAPGTTVRKRYIGDRNAVLGGRSFGTLQPSRALVFVDGYLISNFSVASTRRAGTCCRPRAWRGSTCCRGPSRPCCRATRWAAPSSSPRRDPSA